MKKTTKGAIATGAAVALLLGTGGTLAYWNDSINVGAPSVITAGNLALKQTEAPAWKIKHTSGTETAVADISAVRVVPGDQLVYTGSYAVTAQGNNLVFEATVAPGSITAASDSAQDTALAARLAQSAAYTVNGQTGATGKVSHKSATATDYPVTISVTLDWAFGADGSESTDNPAKLGKVNLSQFAVTAKQLDGATN